MEVLQRQKETNKKQMESKHGDIGKEYKRMAKKKKVKENAIMKAMYAYKSPSLRKMFRKGDMRGLLPGQLCISDPNIHHRPQCQCWTEKSNKLEGG